MVGAGNVLLRTTNARNEANTQTKKRKINFKIWGKCANEKESRKRDRNTHILLPHKKYKFNYNCETCTRSGRSQRTSSSTPPRPSIFLTSFNIKDIRAPREKDHI